MNPHSPQTQERDKLDEYLVSRRVVEKPPLAVLVDAFRFVDRCRAKMEAAWGASSADVHVLYFLSHFHSDHYTGLTPSVAQSCQTVYASRQTAELLVSQLGLPRPCVRPLDFNVRYCFCLSTGKLLAQSVTREEGKGSCLAAEEDQPMMLPSGYGEKDVFFVRLIPANHCPGAAMLLFQSVAFGNILHTGDFRFNGSEASWRAAVHHTGHYIGAPPPLLTERKEGACDKERLLLPPVPFYETFLEDHAALRHVAGRVDTLFLDNTFCDPAFRFLSQWEATQGVIEMLSSLFHSCLREKQVAEQHGDGACHTPSNGKANAMAKSEITVNCALLVGTYTIGKERIAFAAQEAFPLANKGVGTGTAGPPIYVSPSKYELMKGMNFHVDRFRSFADNAGADTLPRPHVPASTPASLGGDEQPSLRSSCGPLEGGSAFPTEPSGQLREVWPEPMEVILPVKVDVRNVGTETANPTAHTSNEARCLLTILLVPLRSVSYPVMAAASGRPPRRPTRRSSNGETSAGRSSVEATASLTRPTGQDEEETEATEESSSPLLDLGDGRGVNLAQYDRVLGVEPTGWARKVKSQRVTDASWILKVPYSEHCAFHEMLSFVALVNPAKVVPTVSLEQYRQQEPLFVERAPRLATRWSNTQPLNRFFTITKRERGATASAATVGAVKQEEETSTQGVRAPRALPAPETKATNPFAAKASFTENRENAPPPGAPPRHTPARRTETLHPFLLSVTRAAPNEASQSSADEACVVTGVKHAVVEISDSDSDPIE